MIVENNHQTNKFKISRLKTPLKIKVVASPHGYGFVFRDLSGKLITSQIGLLPTDFQFDKSSRELYALAEASRRLGCEDMQAYRVALVCSSLPLAGNADRRLAA
jgi:hypothetical protein